MFNKTFSSNNDHIIIYPNTNTNTNNTYTNDNNNENLLHVHLGGTASDPSKDSLQFLETSARVDLVTIGLNYEWGEVDAKRVQLCESQSNPSQVSKAYHHDICYAL